MEALFGSSSPTPPPTSFTPVGGDEGFEPPTLTAEQIAKAQEIFANDPLVQERLRGIDYQVEGPIGPHINSARPDPNEAIGAFWMISLAEPISAEGEWRMPYVPGPGDPPEVRELEPGDAMPLRIVDCGAPLEVRDFIVRVDFKRNSLVQFEPFPEPGVRLNTKCEEGG